MEQTAAALGRMGVRVTIALSTERAIDYRTYDLIHFFNIIRPADILLHIRKSGLPYVVSPVYVEYDELAKHGEGGWRQRMLGFLGKHTGEYLKVLARAWFNGERIVSPEYFFRGHQRSIKYILSGSACLLPNSHSEYARLKRDFPEAGRYEVVPNAIDDSVFREGAEPRKKNSVLCVARFEPRKNQLNVIRALNHTRFEVTFLGNVAANHQSYYRECRNEAAGNISFHDFAGPDTVALMLRQHSVHVLASWFETTGLSSLEAMACGCRAVITGKGDTKEYFGDHAFYCDPGNTQSILRAVEQAADAPEDRVFIEKIKQHYTWEKAARETSRIYTKVLDA